MKKKYCLIVFLVYIGNISSQTSHEQTGILIHHQLNEDTFPVSWKTKEISAKGSSLDSIEIERSLFVIKKALDKYPIDVITQNLKKIYILKSLEFYGQVFGGTNYTDVIYISNSGVSQGYSDFYLEKIFHHEFSSILLRNYPSFMENRKWLNLNKIEYGDGGVEAIKDSAASQEFNSLLNTKGFLHKYATSDFENDFNSFAENLFNPSSSFYGIIRKYPLLKSKFELALNFYASINSAFTTQYFIELKKE